MASLGVFYLAIFFTPSHVGLLKVFIIAGTRLKFVVLSCFELGHPKKLFK